MNLDERAYFLERHKRKKWRKPEPKQEFEQPTPMKQDPVPEPPIKPVAVSTYSLDHPWDITSAWAKTRCAGVLMEHVLDWEVFRNGLAFQTKYEKPAGSSNWLVTPGNVAVATVSYPTQWKVFSPGHELLYLNFDMLHNLDHARILMRHIYEAKGGPCLLRFASNLLQEPIEPIGGELPWLYWMEIAALRVWTPEQICQAAYEAVRPAQQEETDDEME